MDRKSQLEGRFAANLARERPAVAAPAPGQGERTGRRRDMTLFALSINRIRADEDQVRKENKTEADPGVQDLATSIKDVGLLEPINVRYIADGDFYMVVAGERRLVASRIAGLAEVPVRLVEVDESQVRRIQLIENLHRADLTALELASALQDLVDDGASVDDVAKLIHKSKPYVQKALGIARNLSPAAKQRGAELPMDHLYEVSQLPPGDQLDVVQQVQEECLSSKELREAIADRKPRGGRGRPPADKPFRRSFSTPSGISITFSSKEPAQTSVALLEALAHVRKQLANEKSDAA
jgi:ParB/RepB/Spo0J family partition protein